MPYDETSRQGQSRPDLRRDYGSSRIVGPGGEPVSRVRRPEPSVSVAGGTRLDMSRVPLVDVEPDPKMNQPETRNTHRRPGWGLRLFGYCFAFVSGSFLIGILSITCAYILHRYYDHLFK